MPRKKKKDPRGGPGRNQGLRADDGAQDLKRVNVMLDAGTIAKAKTLGAGNLSLGLRKAVNAH